MCAHCNVHCGGGGGGCIYLCGGIVTHVHVILFKLGKPLVLRLLFKVPRNTKYTGGGGGGGDSKVDDEVHVAEYCGWIYSCEQVYMWVLLCSSIAANAYKSVLKCDCSKHGLHFVTN